ncbi:MFS transporter [Methylovirgula sp. 4M-Z18]|uniref:MFS transporter n=1 Tax=Methylovirgula sp. 4M-Z18 TaxID=2293567 RepID=UPI000E2EE3ED|nr:MFS transporter [Methylovirgula sp. 4M-Z18]RFB78936.1 MFS transporter [Methylovirgula sp. 4M-Z18]
MTSLNAAHISLLHPPSFTRFLTARAMSSLSFQITSVVIGWQMYALTSSTVALGLVGLAQFLPMLACTLPAGHFVDRHDRRNVVRICQTIDAAVIALLAIGSFTQLLTPAWIYAACVVIGSVRTFESPASAALLPNIVSAEALPRALALSSSAFQTASIIGPALGGFLYVAGPGVAYATVAVLYLGASFLIASLATSWTAPKKEPASLAIMLQGFSYIRSKPVILGAISLDMVAVLLGGAVALLPVYARDILHASSIGLGFLRAAPAVGALCMSLAIARYSLQRHVGPTMFGAVITFGLATIVFGLSASLPLSLAALAVMGAADVISVVIRSSLVQLETPDEMRGRVSSVNWLFIGTSNQLGEFESGMTAALFGTVPAVVLGGIGTILTALIWMKLFPPLRQVRTLKTAQ